MLVTRGAGGPPLHGPTCLPWSGARGRVFFARVSSLALRNVQHTRLLLGLLLFWYTIQPFPLSFLQAIVWQASSVNCHSPALQVERGAMLPSGPVSPNSLGWGSVLVPPQTGPSMAIQSHLTFFFPQTLFFPPRHRLYPWGKGKGSAENSLSVSLSNYFAARLWLFFFF